MKYSNKITEIYFIIDEFCKELEKNKEVPFLSNENALKRRNRKCKLSDSEVICILTLFHLSGFRKLKTFYIYFVKIHLKSEFPETVSYNRFVELQQKALLPMALFLKTCCLGDCTGVSFIDSTPLRVCHIKREKQHKTFIGIAQKGQCSIGCFFLVLSFI